MQSFLRRIRKLFKTNILNIIGLSIAFAAFIIIIIQVNYDFTYDKSYKDADRIYRLETKYTNPDAETFSPLICRPLGENIAESFSEIEIGTCITSWSNRAYFSRINDQSKPIAQNFVSVSSTFPDLFNLELVEGNFDDLSKPNHLIIPQSVAEFYFPGESISGKELLSGYDKDLSNNNYNKIYTVAAVYKDPPKNSSLKNIIYINIENEYLDNNSEWSFSYYYKLNKGVNSKLLEKEIENFIVNNFYSNDEKESGSTRLNKLSDAYFSRDTQDGMEKGNLPVTISLLTIAILIVVIAIINFINFSMASAPLNIRRINTMKVIGSTNSALRTKQIINIIFLSIFSYGIALLIFYIIAGTTFSSLISADLDFKSNWKILTISGFIAIITGILGGLYPAFYSTSFSPAVVLKGSFGLSAKGRNLRSSLIAFQYVISITLLIVAMFIFVQNKYMKKHDLGFRTENVLTVQTSNTIAEQKDSFLNQLKANPNILDITFSDGPIVSAGKMGWGQNYKGKLINFNCFPVSTNFLDFFDIPIVEGRGFRESDNLKSNGTIIFNEVAKEQFEIEIDDKISGHTEEQQADIVGIVKNFNFQPLQYKIQPIALYIFGTEPWRLQTYAYIKITGNDVNGSIDHTRKTLAEFDHNLTGVNINFMDKGIESLYQKEDNLAKLILISCALSVFISIIGILGLVFFETQFRKKEIGIRRVFGSAISEILSMINKAYLKITLICFIISVPIAYFIIKEWLKNFAYRSPIPFWIWISAFVVIFALTSLIITLQSLRTAKANPVESIKINN